MESRSGIVAVFLLVAASCGGESESSLFGTPADSGEGGDGSSAGKGEQSSGGSASSGRAGSSGKGGSSGATGSAGKGSESGSAGSAQAGEAGESGSETGGAGGNGASGGSGANGGSGATSAAGGSDPSGGRPGGGQAGLGTGGKNEADCDEIAAAYAEALAEAQVCDPNAEINECTAQLASDLGCGCTTFANVNNDEALATLQSLQLKALRTCPIVVCPAIACELPEVGTCSSSGSGKGHCVAGPIDR